MTSSLIQDLLEARHSDFTRAVLEVIDDACNEDLQPTDIRVAERVLAKIRELGQPSFRGSLPLTPAEMSQRIEKALEYEAELRSKTAAELQELYQQNKKQRQEARRKKALQFDASLFGHPKHKPDFELWNRRLVWSVSEGICLSLDKEPTTTSFTSDPLLPSVLRDEYELRADALKTMERLDLDDKRPIDFFVRWFGENGIATPPDYGRLKDREISAAAEDLIAELRSEIASLRKELKKAQPDIDRRSSINAIIYCTAVNEFGYDPTKLHNKAVKDIENLTAKISLDKENEKLKCSNNSVRDVLKDAAKFLGEIDDDL